MGKPYRLGDVPPPAVARIKAKRGLLAMPAWKWPRRCIAGMQIVAVLAPNSDAESRPSTRGLRAGASA